MKVGLDDFFAAGGTVALLMSVVVDALTFPTQPVYPVDAFPPQAQRYITEVSASLNNAPPEMIGLPLLGFAAGAIRNTRVLHVEEGWRERAILWAAIIARTGSAKTPVQEAARHPLQQLQDTAEATWDTQMNQFHRDLASWEGLPKKECGAIAKPKPLPFPHFISTEATEEALAPMAAESPGFTVFRDELAAWVESFDVYRAGRGRDRQDMLSLWSGSGLKIDRKGAPPIVARRPTISVAGGVQPDLLPRLSRDAGSDGFLARFLWTWADVGVLRWSSAAVSSDAREGICELFARLRTALQTHPASWRVRLSEAVLACFVLWHKDNADEQEVMRPLLAGIYAKFPSQVLRLTLVLHCLWHPDPSEVEVSLATMNGAIDLVEFHPTAAIKVAQVFEAAVDRPTQKPGLAQPLLRIFINSEGVVPENRIPRSHLSDRIRPPVTPNELTTALGDLVDRGELEHRTRKTRGRSVDEYRLRTSENPKKSVPNAGHDDAGEEGDL